MISGKKDIMMERMTELGTKPIGKLLAQYSIPAVVAMLINAVYNVVDRIFIGKLVGEDALAGLTIAFPVMMIMFAFSGLIGAGGAALLSIRLGEKNDKGASHVFGNTLTFGFLVTASVLIILFINLNGFLTFFGATKSTLPYANTYMAIILGGFIFQMFSFILGGFVRTEGKPMLSMIAMIISSVVNIVLDYIFIGMMDLGVAGAAYGTIIGQLVGLVMYLNFYFRGRSSIHLQLQDFFLDIKVMGQIISIGFTTFITTISTSVAMVMMNRGLVEYSGTAGVTSMGAINSLYTFFVMPLMGITAGMQPIVGYNYGAKQQKRVDQALRLSIIVGCIFSTVVFILLEIFATSFVGVFLEDGSPTVPMAANGLRIFILMLPFLSISFMGTAYFQSTVKAKNALFLGLLRQFLFLLPLLFILPKIWGLNGVWIATPIADALAIIITLLVLVKDHRANKVAD